MARIRQNKIQDQLEIRPNTLFLPPWTDNKGEDKKEKAEKQLHRSVTAVKHQKIQFKPELKLSQQMLLSKEPIYTRPLEFVFYCLP